MKQDFSEVDLLRSDKCFSFMKRAITIKFYEVKYFLFMKQDFSEVDLLRSGRTRITFMKPTL
jgi:hypothetical protein